MGKTAILSLSISCPEMVFSKPVSTQISPADTSFFDINLSPLYSLISLIFSSLMLCFKEILPPVIFTCESLLPLLSLVILYTKQLKASSYSLCLSKYESDLISSFTPSPFSAEPYTQGKSAALFINIFISDLLKPEFCSKISNARSLLKAIFSHKSSSIFCKFITSNVADDIL